jgi:uncharacterized protein (TIGR02284 family)
MANDSTIDQLNRLIQTNKDAEAGFRTAEENVENTEIQTLFSGYAVQHARFAAQLQSEVERLGGKSEDSGTLGGSLHRGWMDVKSALSGHSVGSMITACETGEQAAESAYLDAIENNPHGQTHTLLEKHCEQIRGFRARITRLVGEIKDGFDFQKTE